MEQWEDIRTEGTRCYRMKKAAAAENGYRYHMLRNNSIPGILALEERERNGSRAYAFDISSRTSLKTFCEWGTLKSAQLSCLVRSIGEAFSRAEEYLLEPDCFLLEAEDIYVVPDTFEVSLCCLPCPGTDWREQIQNLFRFLMERIDYKEEAGVQMIYSLYHASIMDHITFPKLLECIGEENREEPFQISLTEYPGEKEGDEREAKGTGLISGVEEKRKKKSSFSPAAFISRILPFTTVLVFLYCWFGR